MASGLALCRIYVMYEVMYVERGWSSNGMITKSGNDLFIYLIPSQYYI